MFLTYSFIMQFTESLYNRFKCHKSMENSFLSRLKSFNQVAVISIVNKLKSLSKYGFQSIYSKANSNQISESISKVLSLSKIVDLPFKTKLWSVALEDTVLNYFHYFLLHHSQDYQLKESRRLSYNTLFGSCAFTQSRLNRSCLSSSTCVVPQYHRAAQLRLSLMQL